MRHFNSDLCAWDQRTHSQYALYSVGKLSCCLYFALVLKQTSHKGQLKTTLCSFSDEVKLHCLKPAKTGELKDKTLLILQIKEPVILPAE